MKRLTKLFIISLFLSYFVGCDILGGKKEKPPKKDLTKIDPFKDDKDLFDQDLIPAKKWVVTLLPDNFFKRLGIDKDKMANEAAASISYFADEIKQAPYIKAGPPKCTLLRTFQGKTFVTNVNSVSFSPNGRQLAAGSPDGNVTFWNVETGAELSAYRQKPVNCVVFSPDGKKLALLDSSSPKLFDVDAGKEIISFEGAIDSGCAISLSPNGDLLAAGSTEESILVFEIKTGKLIKTLKGHTKSIHSVVFSPDSRFLASGSKDLTIRLWDLSKGKEIKTLEGHSSNVYSVAFSPDGKLLVSGGLDNTARVWDIANGKELFVLTGHKHFVWSVAFSPTGKLVATGSYDKLIKIWDVSTGKEIKSLSGHNSPVKSLSFSSDGKLLVSAGERDVKLWDIANTLIVENIKGLESTLMFQGIHPDNKFIVFGRDQAGKVYALLASDSDSIDLSEGKPEKAPFPKAKIQLVSNDTINAGDPISLNLTVDNTSGKGELYQVVAVSESDSDSTVNKKLIFFGKISSGTDLTKNVTFPTDFRSSDKKVRIGFKFFELNDYYPEPVSVDLSVKQQTHPNFGISLQVFDGQNNKGTGNSDGILQKLESPEVQISIRNTGGAGSGKTMVKVVGLTNSTGLEVFGDLKKEVSGVAVGEVVSLSFDLALKPTYQADRVSFKVSINEDKFGIEKTEDVELIIGNVTERKPITINRELRVDEDKAPLYSGASKTTDVIGYLSKGIVVRAKSWLGDFYQIDLANGATGWLEASKMRENTKEGTDISSNVTAPTVIFEADNSPIVAIIAPETGSITDSKRLKIKGYAKDDKGVKKLEFSVNGKVVLTKNADGKRYDFSDEVEVADGQNRIIVTAEDTKGNREGETVTVSYLGRFPILKDFYKNVWAVVIGVNKFKDPSIPELKYAVRDAKGVESLLKNKVVAGKLITLYDEEATRDNIMRVLQGEIRDAEKDDAVFVYIACHGKTFDPGSNALGYLVPHDGSFEKKETWKNISMQLFRDEISRGVRSKHMFVVVDACYGGVLTRGVGIKKEDSDDAGKGDYLKQLKDKDAKIVMTAGADDEEVLDGGPGDHSVFTGRFIELVENSKGFISAKDLYGQLKLKVEEDAKKRNHKQTPQFGYWWGDGDFIFIRK
ncbi:MAG: caspase family protein [Planctomycetes bacterium]|nr:caspase family protein [Planctomycetota bacterium]